MVITKLVYLMNGKLPLACCLREPTARWLRPWGILERHHHKSLFSLLHLPSPPRLSPHLLLWKTAVSGECMSSVICLPQATLGHLQSWEKKETREIFIWLYQKGWWLLKGLHFAFHRTSLITNPIDPMRSHECKNWKQRSLITHHSEASFLPQKKTKGAQASAGPMCSLGSWQRA